MRDSNGEENDELSTSGRCGAVGSNGKSGAVGVRGGVISGDPCANLVGLSDRDGIIGLCISVSVCSGADGDLFDAASSLFGFNECDGSIGFCLVRACAMSGPGDAVDSS